MLKNSPDCNVNKTEIMLPPRYYTGPVSDHFDGGRFFDPHGVPARSRRDLPRWFADRRRRGTKAKWPVWAPPPYADRPPARVEGSTWRICYVGHASFLIQTAGLNILLDRSARHLHALSGQSALTSPASRLPICRLSMSSWCRTATTIISMSVLCRG